MKSAPDGPRAALIANGNIAVCKVAGPPGTYHFHVDVSGGGNYTVSNSGDNDVVFDGTNLACAQSAYSTVNDASWTPGLTATVTITETQIPTGITVDSILLTDRFGDTQSEVVSNPAIVVTEGATDIHTVRYYNAALPSVSCTAINAIVNQPLTPVTLTASGGSGGPYTFTATGLPAGVSISTGGTISGTPSATGSFPYTVTVTDKDGHSATSAGCTLTVGEAPSASCVAISAVQNVAITPVTLVGSGGTGGPYHFSSSNLPAGLSISDDGTISGTPTATGTFNYTITIKDKDGNTGTINCSVTVAPPPSATCVTINAVQNVPITPVTLVGSGGTGGPYTFSATGLPTGLTMSTTGTISGTPTVNGTFNYTVTVTDKDGHSSTINCSVTVAPSPYANCVAIVGAVQGQAITPVTLVGSGGTGGPYTFSSTTLPAGLSISTDGTISGTPTVSGTINYTIIVKDKDGNAGSVNCGVTISPPPSATCVTIVAVKNVAITPVTLVGSGGTGGPYTFSATGLPNGLTMSTSGTISGTPTVSGTFNYTVTVTDKDGHSSTINCSVTVSPPCSGNCVTVNATQGTAITPVYLQGSGGAGGPYTFSATGLPSGITLGTDGKLSGTPTVSGTFTYTVTVTDKNGNKSSFQCTIVVKSKPGCSSCVTIVAYKGVAITPAQVTGSGGAGGPYTFTATGLPSGLSISSSGVISGTPTVSGTFTYTVTVTDKDGNKGSFDCSVTVKTDSTPPVCSVYESANPPYMSYQDNGSGIVRLDVTTNLNNNFKVQITPTPTGTTFSPAIGSQPYAMPSGEIIKFPTPQTGLIKVLAYRVNSRVSSQLTVKATNAAGQTVSCDPIMTTVIKMKQDDGDQTFNNLSYDEHFVRVENGGLRAVDLDVNGTTFHVRRLDDTEVRIVDVSSAMKHNNKNSITISPKGKKGETADITIGPDGTP